MNQPDLIESILAAERQLREIDAGTEKKLRQMEKIFREKKDEWAREIFEQITGKAGE